jgi:hypothetical protein
MQGHLYAFCLDIAGSDENTYKTTEPGTESKRDSTALTIFEIILPAAGDILPGSGLPSFHVVHRRTWLGSSQVSLFRQIYSLADIWRPHRLVIDATGVGEGLSSFLNKSFPGQVIPFKFSQMSKSDLGWRLLSAIETGRFKDYAQIDNTPLSRVSLGEISTSDQGYLQAQFYKQLAACTLELLPGPSKLIRWNVPDAARDSAGELIHDDLLLSAALAAAMFEEKGLGTAESVVIRAFDPLSEMSY